MNIQGEYRLNINVPTMFGCFGMSICNHNIVTLNGTDFILHKIINETDDYIESLAIGKNSSEANVNNTIHDIIDLTKHMFEDSEVSSEKVTFYVTITGEYLTDTSEIGLLTRDNVLVTRDVHDVYDIPSTATIMVEYTLILNNVEREMLEEEEILND